VSALTRPPAATPHEHERDQNFDERERSAAIHVAQRGDDRAENHHRRSARRSESARGRFGPRIRRKRDVKRRAAFARALHPHQPAEIVHNAAHNREAEACTVLRRLRGDERLKNLLLEAVLTPWPLSATTIFTTCVSSREASQRSTRSLSRTRTVATSSPGRRSVPSASVARGRRLVQIASWPPAGIASCGVEQKIRERLLELEREVGIYRQWLVVRVYGLW